MPNQRLYNAALELCTLLLCAFAAPIAIRTALRHRGKPFRTQQPWTDNAYPPLQEWYDEQVNQWYGEQRTLCILLVNIDTLMDDVSNGQSLTHGSTDVYLSEMRVMCQQMGVPENASEWVAFQREVMHASCPSPP